MVCTKLGELLLHETPHLKREVEKHQWYLGEQSGEEVSIKDAERDYLLRHGPSYMAGFKDCFCTLVCSDRDDCEYAMELKRQVEEKNGEGHVSEQMGEENCD